MDMYDEVVEVEQRPKSKGHTSVERINESKQIVEKIDDSERTTTKRPGSSLPRKSAKSVERLSSESESSDTGTDDAKAIVDGFDYRQWENLDVPPEIKELYQYIARLAIFSTKETNFFYTKLIKEQNV